MAKLKEKDDTIVVTEVMEGSVDAVLVGRSPLVFNRMSEKAKRRALVWLGTTQAWRGTGTQVDNGLAPGPFHLLAEGFRRSLLYRERAANNRGDRFNRADSRNYGYFWCPHPSDYLLFPHNSRSCIHLFCLVWGSFSRNSLVPGVSRYSSSLTD